MQCRWPKFIGRCHTYHNWPNYNGFLQDRGDWPTLRPSKYPWTWVNKIMGILPCRVHSNGQLVAKNWWYKRSCRVFCILVRYPSHVGSRVKLADRIETIANIWATDTEWLESVFYHMSSISYPMSSVYLMLVIPHVSQFIGYPFLFVIHNIPAFFLEDILRCYIPCSSFRPIDPKWKRSSTSSTSILRMFKMFWREYPAW